MRPSVTLWGGEGVGWGARLRRGGRPVALSPSHPLAPIAWPDGARPSPASSLVLGLGLGQWWGSQLVSSAAVMRSTAPPSRKASHVGSLRARPPKSPPGGLSRGPLGPPTPLVPPGSPHPSGGARHRRAGSSSPELAQLSPPYTSTTRERASSPRGSGTVSQSRSQGPAPPAPCASSPCGPCA